MRQRTLPGRAAGSVMAGLSKYCCGTTTRPISSVLAESYKSSRAIAPALALDGSWPLAVFPTARKSAKRSQIVLRSRWIMVESLMTITSNALVANATY